MAEVSADKQMKLRYAGQCHLCARELPARAEAIYDRTTKTVRCVDCSPEPLPEATSVEASAEPIVVVEQAEGADEVQQVEVGSAGLSARREFERRHANREQRIRTKHRKVGGLMLALSDDPQSTTAWDKGALGEERLANGLNKRSSPSLRVLHDRRIPGTRANIDHIAATPSGIWVIDAKRYVGKRPTLRVEGGLFRPRTETLMVGGRKQNRLVDGMLKQLEVVRGVIGQAIPVTGVLCFIESDWPLIGGDFTTRGVRVTWPKRLYSRLEAEGSLTCDVETHHRNLAQALPSA
ncbi:nuclease-related domain-containing protein [Knoellia sp. S7-12]|uniref:nuclease-related domain-containing protein n=1 Tax=Knoellia sp. S7-12 TaxID=3126698 RepID=UPI0033683E1D